jgi:hypothetical protein
MFLYNWWNRQGGQGQGQGEQGQGEQGAKREQGQGKEQQGQGGQEEEQGQRQQRQGQQGAKGKEGEEFDREAIETTVDLAQIQRVLSHPISVQQQNQQPQNQVQNSQMQSPSDISLLDLPQITRKVRRKQRSRDLVPALQRANQRAGKFIVDHSPFVSQLTQALDDPALLNKVLASIDRQGKKQIDKFNEDKIALLQIWSELNKQIDKLDEDDQHTSAQAVSPTKEIIAGFAAIKEAIGRY